MISEQIALAAMLYFGQVLFSMVSTNNNVLWTDPQTFLVETIPADAQYWTVTLWNWKKQPPEIFYINDVLKNFAIFTGKHLCEIFKNTHFEEHLPTAASKLSLWSDCLELCFWIAFKPILTQYYYKNTSRFQTKALNKIWHICCLYI